MTIKTIDTSVVSEEMIKVADSMDVNGYFYGMFEAMAEVAPAVKVEPVGYTNESQLYYASVGKEAAFWPDTENDTIIPLYTHPSPQQTITQELRETAYCRIMRNAL